MGKIPHRAYFQRPKEKVLTSLETSFLVKYTHRPFVAFRIREFQSILYGRLLCKVSKGILLLINMVLL